MVWTHLAWAKRGLDMCRGLGRVGVAETGLDDGWHQQDKGTHDVQHRQGTMYVAGAGQCVQKRQQVARYDGDGAGLVTGMPWAQSKVERTAGYMKKGLGCIGTAGRNAWGRPWAWTGKMQHVNGPVSHRRTAQVTHGRRV